MTIPAIKDSGRTTAQKSSGSPGSPGEARLGPVDQIPLGEGRTFVVADRQIAVFRLRDGRLRGLDAACPHRAGPLADGQIDCEVVICPLHAHTFNLTDGTSPTGQPPVRTYQVTEVNGELVITL